MPAASCSPVSKTVKRSRSFLMRLDRSLSTGSVDIPVFSSWDSVRATTRRRRVVALTESQLENTGISTEPVDKLRSNLIKKLLDRFTVFDTGEHDAAGMEIAPLGKGYQPFDKRTDFLG